METDIPEIELPWSGFSPRWGHPWHSMCSYLGAFPAPLARTMVSLFTDEGDTVLDPFSGRGTTLLEARLLGRTALASDLNPIAIALSRAKNVLVTEAEVLDRLAYLERKYDKALYAPDARVQSENIRLIYNLDTLAQLCYLRRTLLRSTQDVDHLLVGAVLGVMHGAERKDGTSAYASISMPNTFSMSPDYVRRFVANNRLARGPRDVFEILRAKVARLFKAGPFEGPQGKVKSLNVRDLKNGFSEYAGQVDLILTSPPYLGVVNYARQNWIRTWFLDADPEEITRSLDDGLATQDWLRFTESVIEEMQDVLSPTGVAVLVIGDVARPDKSVISLAGELIRRVLDRGEFGFVGCVSDHMQTDNKTTRIWNETKGKATTVDRIVVLSKETPHLNWSNVARDLGGKEVPSAQAFNSSDLQRNAQAFALGQ